jgi:hypothetical protein
MWIRRLDLKYIQPGSSKAHESEWDGPEVQYNLPTTLAYLLSPVALHLGLVLFHQSNRVARSPPFHDEFSLHSKFNYRKQEPFSPCLRLNIFPILELG